jgi:hypothetical protein
MASRSAIFPKPDPLSGYKSASIQLASRPSTPPNQHRFRPAAPPHHCHATSTLTCRASTSPPRLRSAVPPCCRCASATSLCLHVIAATLTSRASDPSCLRSLCHNIATTLTQRTDAQPFHNPHAFDLPHFHVAATPVRSLGIKWLSVDKKMAEGFLWNEWLRVSVWDQMT